MEILLTICHLIADFRLNILSLDDLAPNITSEAAELKQKVSRNSLVARFHSACLVEGGYSKINTYTPRKSEVGTTHRL